MSDADLKSPDESVADLESDPQESREAAATIDLAQIIEGDEGFKAQFDVKEAEPAGPKQIPLTIDKDGKVIGDTTGIDQNILEQLSTPEYQEKMRKMYRSWHNGGDPMRRRPPRYLHKLHADPLPGVPAILQPEASGNESRRIKPPGISRKEFRRINRKTFKFSRKIALEAMKEINDGERQS